MVSLHSSVRCSLLALLPLSGCLTPTQSGLRDYQSGDFSVALSEWTPEAESGNPRAQFALGLLHENGEGVEQDFEQAAHWYGLAADKGFAPAQTNLGLLYYEGRGFEQDFDEAADLFELAADQGFAAAQSNLGVMYMLGQSVPQDNGRARTLLTSAADQGDSKARTILSTLPDEGDLNLIALAEAAEECREVEAEQDSGPTVDVDLTDVAEYRAARGDSQALSWLERSAREGVADAQVALGLLLRYGIGTEADSERAAAWLSLAAEQESAVAQCEIGLMHLCGEGVTPNDKIAAQWLRSSASHGNPIAQHNLGLLFAQGRGVSRDLITARLWIERAAENGLAQAHLKLGALDENESITRGDLGAAYRHYLIAERLGAAGASAHRDLLDQRMTSEQTDAARSRAERWLLQHEADKN